VREVDLRRKFHFQAQPLAVRVGPMVPRSKVLRQHRGVDDDARCSHVFEFGSQKIRCFSDNAVTKMVAALDHVDMDRLWADRAR